MRPTKISSRKIVEIHLDTLTFPNSGNRAHHILFKSPESVAILPVLDKNKVLMVKQFRYVINEYSWEIPAGGINQDESPAQAATRELLEETSYKATQIQPILSFYPSNSISNERMHIYCADGLIKQDNFVHHDEPFEEDMEVKAFALEELKGMLDDHILTDAATLIAIQYFLLRKNRAR